MATQADTLIGSIEDAMADVNHERDRTGGSRELSLCFTKLQEAHFWAKTHDAVRKEAGLE